MKTILSLLKMSEKVTDYEPHFTAKVNKNGSVYLEKGRKFAGRTVHVYLVKDQDDMTEYDDIERNE